MSGKRFSLDVRENNKLSRVAQLVFGILCLVFSGLLLYYLIKSGSAEGTNLIAVAFLFFFGVWMLLSSAGITGRYIEVSDEKIVLKEKYLNSPRVYHAADLTSVEFKPLAFDLNDSAGIRTTVRLGTYYRERSAEVLEAVQGFCNINNITVIGLGGENK